MAPGQHAPEPSGNSNFNFSYHPITIRQNRENGAPFCLGENPDFKPFDLCYSFKDLVCVEYGGFASLHEAAWNYQCSSWKKPPLDKTLPGFFFKFKTLPRVFPLKTTNWKPPLNCINPPPCDIKMDCYFVTIFRNVLFI